MVHLSTVNLWSGLPSWDRAKAKSNIFTQCPHMRVLKKPISTAAETDLDFLTGREWATLYPVWFPVMGLLTLTETQPLGKQFQ